ncbi:MAG: hypothetical protein JRN15_04420, partial [Nitrososphaerota archaeon]|nr:hypothetical protein [Nitrososphaerota archaeon]
KERYDTLGRGLIKIRVKFDIQKKDEYGRFVAGSRLEGCHKCTSCYSFDSSEKHRDVLIIMGKLSGTFFHTYIYWS